MKNYKYSLITACLLVSGLQSCNLLNTDAVIDPNNPSLASVQKDATKSQLDALAVGQIARSRDGLATYRQVMGTLGKELFNFNTTESRWMTELNGVKPIDNSAFYNGATTGFGPSIRQANVLLASLEATNSVSANEKNAYKGLANTFKGLAYLNMLSAQGKNGVRLNMEDPLNPSKYVTYDESLAGIKKFLDDGASLLDQSGAAFPFSMPTGFAGFNTPAKFKQFNRAIALRVAIYQKDWAGAATLLSQTFVSETGDLNLGPRHTFNPTSPDIANPLLNTSSVRVVAVEKLVDEAEAGDKRISSKLKVQTPALAYSSGVNYSSKYLINMFTSATQDVGIIRNEELLLIAAEVAAQQGKTDDATKFINIVRKGAGLDAYAGKTDKDALINAILKERLWSLLYEGHRLVDMRRYGKIADIYVPVASMKVLENLERPAAEIAWDKYKGN
jgi:starch-binding outer membrane protein, SusD/RagB family